MPEPASVVMLCAGERPANDPAASLPAEQFSVRKVDTAEELYRTMKATWFDFVIVENELEGFFRGIDILERIHADLIRPATVLLAQPSDELKTRARNIGVDCLLPPDADLATLQRALVSLATSHETTELSIHPMARQLVAKSCDVDPLPQLILKLVPYLLKPEEMSLRELADTLAVDARLTADLLRVVNSPSMGVVHKITKVLDAVALLGVRRTIALILTSRLFNAKQSLTQRMMGDCRGWYYKRCVLTASAAYAFARHLENVSPDTAYVLGLFQEVGIAIQANALGEKYLQLLLRVRKTGPLRLELAEKNQHGFTHADVGAALLERWGLPVALLVPVLEHHSSEALHHRNSKARFLRTMQLSEALANLADGHFPHRLPVLLRLLHVYGKENASACREAFAEAVRKAAESCELFQVPVPDQDSYKKLMDVVTVSLRSPGPSAPSGPPPTSS
jgi:HD-like signal output (HDOD) protein